LVTETSEKPALENAQPILENNLKFFPGVLQFIPPRTRTIDSWLQNHHNPALPSSSPTHQSTTHPTPLPRFSSSGIENKEVTLKNPQNTLPNNRISPH
jgi:hypothetical protein